MKIFAKRIYKKLSSKLQVIHSRLKTIDSIKTQVGTTWRTAVLIAFFLTFSITGINTHAHTPHDMVIGLGVSPNFAVDKTLYLATDGPLTGWGYEDILRSTDGGTTWTNIPNGMDHPFKFSAIRVSPNFGNDNTLFVATRGGGVYQSLDRGNSWQRFSTGLPKGNLIVTKLEIAGSKGVDGYVLFLSDVNGTLFRRPITQTDWIQVQGPSAVAVIAASPDFTQDTTVITANASGNLRISTNGGTGWNDIGNPAGGAVYDIAIAPGGSREIFLATHSGIFYSDDSGSTFTKKLSNLPAGAINNVAISPNYLTDRTVFCTSVTKAVYKSTDGGSNWTLFNSGAVITKQTTALNEFSELQISSTFSTDKTVFLSAFDGLFVSTDGGSIWKQKQTRVNLLTGLSLSPFFKDDHRLIATSYFGSVYSSADSGATWTISNWPGRLRLNTFDSNFTKNGTGSPTAVSATSQHLGFSSDFGETWNVVDIPYLLTIASTRVSMSVLAVSPDFDINQDIYLGTRDHGILQTVDRGVSWRTPRGVPTTSQTTSLVVSPNYVNDRTAFAANRAGAVWRTTNGGESWLRIGASSIVTPSGPAHKYTWIAVSPNFAADQLVLVGTNNGVFRSGDGGDSWVPLISNEIGPANVIQQIEFSPDFSNDRIVYVNVRGKGLYRVPLNLGGNGWVVASTPQNMGQWLLERNIQFSEFRISPTFAQDSTLMGVARKVVYISRDGGLTWAVAGRPGV